MNQTKSNEMNTGTTVIKVDAKEPDAAAIASAREQLCQGGLVAFPTETVYGLGANAMDSVAVSAIFTAKGRPANNPLIVHVADTQAAQDLTLVWPEVADRLAARFWPGPLTLVLPKHPDIPDVVTGGGETVALRVPAHPVALALLRAAGIPIAAPSANRSEEISPTCADHVLRSLSGRIPLILDGGPTSGGLESTVLSLVTEPPVLLRPGLISPAEIEAVIGSIDRPSGSLKSHLQEEALSSPGQMPRHYAPHVPLELREERGDERVQELLANGERVGWLAFGDRKLFVNPDLVTLSLPVEVIAYSAGLYAALHQLDTTDVSRIVVESPPDAEEWMAVRDRLSRAAHPPAAS